MKHSFLILSFLALWAISLAATTETRNLAACGKVSASTKCGPKYGRCYFGSCSRYRWCGTSRAYKIGTSKTWKARYNALKGCKRPAKKVSTRKVVKKIAKKVKRKTRSTASLKKYVLKLSKAPRKIRTRLVKKLSRATKQRIGRLCKKGGKRGKRVVRGKRAKKTSGKGRKIRIRARLSKRTKKALKTAKKGRVNQVYFKNVVKGYKPMWSGSVAKAKARLVSYPAPMTWASAKWTVRWLTKTRFQLLTANKKFALGRYSWVWAGLVPAKPTKTNTFTYNAKTLQLRALDGRVLDIWQGRSTVKNQPFVWWSAHKGANQKFRMQVLSRTAAKRFVKKTPKKVAVKAKLKIVRAKKQLKKATKGKKANLKKLIKKANRVKRKRLISKRSGKKGKVVKSKKKSPAGRGKGKNVRMARIVSANSNKSLDIWARKYKNLNKLVQWSSHGGDNQKFRVVFVGKNRFRIGNYNGKWWLGQYGRWVRIMSAKRAGLGGVFYRNKKTGAIVNARTKQCMDVAGFSKKNGANLLWWRCHGGKNQRFIFKWYGKKRVARKVSKKAKKAYKKLAKKLVAKRRRIVKRLKFTKRTKKALKTAKKGRVNMVRFRNIVKNYNPMVYGNKAANKRKIISYPANKSWAGAKWTVKWLSKTKFMLISMDKRYALGRYNWYWAGLVPNKRTRATVFSYSRVTKRIRSDEGRCLDIWQGRSTVKGQPFVWWSCHNGNNQKFVIDVLSRAAAKKAVKKAPKKVFKKAKKRIVKARKVIRKFVAKKRKLPAQRVVKLKCVNSKLDLDIWRGQQRLNQKVVQWSPHGGNNQKFRLIYVSKYRFRIAAFNNSGLTMGRSGIDVKLQRWNPKNKSQIFRFYNKKHAIINNEGKCLDIAGGSKNRGQRLIFWSCHYGKNQQWLVKNLSGAKKRVATKRAKKVRKYRRVIKKQKTKGWRTNLYIGNYSRNTKCVNVSKFYRYSCPSNCTKSNCRVNKDFRTANDRFKLTWKVGKVCAKRLDSKGGWGMRLRVKCMRYRRSYRKVVKKRAAKSRKYSLYIGNSGSNRRCVNVPANVRLVCPSRCGKGCRTNTDFRTAGDTFKMTWSPKRACAQRLDARGGWGMRLRVNCRAYTRKVVKRARKVAKRVRKVRRPRRSLGRISYHYFGPSRGNTRCIKVSKRTKVTCNTICYRGACRVNRDFWGAGDRFRMSWQPGRLCAKRVDSKGGWGMRLRVKCRSYTLNRRIIKRIAKRVAKRVVKLRNVRAKKDVDVWRGQIKLNQKEVIWHPHGGHNQKFRVNRLPGNRFQLEAYNNANLVLGQTRGYVVRLVKKNPKDKGQILRYYGAKKAIINNNGRCLDVAGGRTNAGTGLYFWSCHWNTNQQFWMVNTK